MTIELYIEIRKKLAEIIKKTIWEGHVYFVGGCVRDELMHQPIHDIDVAVDLPNGGIRFASWLHKNRYTARGRGPMFFIHFGTSKFRLRGFPKEIIDCVQTRKDRYVYEDPPHPAKNFGTILEDCMCRDLTINSLFLNITTGELLDPTGKGLEDIENHIIRTPNDPDISLNDNAMHILRCIRFACRYEWELSPTLFEAMKRNVAIVGEATATRMLNEVVSIMSIEQKDRALQLIEEVGAMPFVEPFLALAELQMNQSKEEKPNNQQHRHRRRQARNRKRHNATSSKPKGRHSSGQDKTSATRSTKQNRQS